jgi:hypothetical protein
MDAARWEESHFFAFADFKVTFSKKASGLVSS